jgi:8-amino-7-oxononanoate synthase
MPPPPSALENKLASSLASRDERLIRRRLPDPNASITSSTTTTSSSSADAKLKKTSNERLIDFTSNDYLSLSTSPHLRKLFLKKLIDAPDILGSGGSRLLVNGRAHSAFEARLKEFFCGPTPPTFSSSGSGFDRGISGVLGGRTVIATPNITTTPAALLFNSGFDANVGFFSCIPQPGDAIVYDEYIHASVHDGMRVSRVQKGLRRGFRHNDLGDLRRVLRDLQAYSLPPAHRAGQGPFASGASSIFVSVESLYSMDGTFSPLKSISDILDEMFPNGNAYLIVDEAHATGIYGPQGRGRVAELGLEGKVLARLHTFGKALAATGGG